MSVFYNNFLRLCDEKGVSPSKAGEEIGLSSAAVTGWKKGSAPRDSAIKKLCAYFNCEVEDLINEKSPDTQSAGASGELSEYANYLFNQLSIEQKIQLISQMQAELQKKSILDAQQELN